jgi:hypothetical protein
MKRISMVLVIAFAALGVASCDPINPNANPRAAAYAMVHWRGWDDAQYQCLSTLWDRESSWNMYATNPSSGAYGIPQALPASKMASVAADWRTSAAAQINWGLDYIAGRYGNPCGALAHSYQFNWY